MTKVQKDAVLNYKTYYKKKVNSIIKDTKNILLILAIKQFNRLNQFELGYFHLIMKLSNVIENILDYIKKPLIY